MHTSISDLFAGLWADYVTITPSAARIHKLLQQHDNNNEIINPTDGSVLEKSQLRLNNAKIEGG